MDFSTVDLKRCTLVRLGGRIDGSVAPELGSNLRNLTDSDHHKLVLNMKEVSYTSSAALRELINTWKTCRRWNRGDLRLAEVNPNIRKVLDLTGLSTQFMLFDTEAEAVGSFSIGCYKFPASRFQRSSHGISDRHAFFPT